MERLDSYIKFGLKPILISPDFRDIPKASNRTESNYRRFVLSAADRAESAELAFSSEEDHQIGISHFSLGTLQVAVLDITDGDLFMKFFGEPVPSGVYFHFLLYPAAAPGTIIEKLVPVTAVSEDLDGYGTVLISSIPTAHSPGLRSALTQFNLGFSGTGGSDLGAVLAWNFAEDGERFKSRKSVVSSESFKNIDLDVPFQEISIPKIEEELTDRKLFQASLNELLSELEPHRTSETELRFWTGLRSASKETRELAAKLGPEENERRDALMSSTTFYVLEVSIDNQVTHCYLFARKELPKKKILVNRHPL
jgi:hypothetical protein